MGKAIILSLEFALCIQFIYATFQPGMILHGFCAFLKRYTPEAIHKPLFDCTICMSGIYTVVFMLINCNYFGIWTIWAIMLTGGWNCIFQSLIQYLNYDE